MWKAAVDIICGELCLLFQEENPNNWENAITALTHPEISRRSFSAPTGTFEAAIGVCFFLDSVCSSDESGSVMEEIQTYLCDPERAGTYFVDGGMYATLCLRLFKIVLASDTL